MQDSPCNMTQMFHFISCAARNLAILQIQKKKKKKKKKNKKKKNKKIDESKKKKKKKKIDVSKVH